MKSLSVIAKITCYLMVILLIIIKLLLGYVNSFNGVDLLIIISFISIIYIRNIYLNKIKIIYNLFYNILLIGFMISIIYIEIDTLFILFNDVGEANIYFFNKILIILGILIVNYIISLFFKKDVIVKNKSLTLQYFLLCFISLLTIIVGIGSFINLLLTVVGTIIPLILIIKMQNIILRDYFVKWHLILILINVFTLNFVNIFILIGIYLNFDKYVNNV